MTIRTPAWPVSRRRTLLGSAALAGAPLIAGPLGMPFIRRAAAADPIRIGLLLAKTGADRAADRISGATAPIWRWRSASNMIMRPAGRAGVARRAEPAGGDSRTCRSWCRRIRSARFSAARSVPTRWPRKRRRRELKIPFVMRQRGGDRDHRQELQPLHVPAEHAGAGAVARCSRRTR